MKTSNLIISFCLTVLYFLAPLSLFAQEVNDVYIETSATIRQIEIARSGRSVKELATVDFNLEDGQKWETIVELERVPFLGSFRSEGEELKIYYNQANPSVAQTYIGRMLAQYGLYLLILIGIIASGFTYVRALRQSKKQ